jgi:hypothetical protein
VLLLLEEAATSCRKHPSPDAKSQHPDCEYLSLQNCEKCVSAFLILIFCYNYTNSVIQKMYQRSGVLLDQNLKCESGFKTG